MFYFSLTFSREITIEGAGICVYLNMIYYNRGSEQTPKESNHKLGVPPLRPSATTGTGLAKVELHRFDRDSMVC